MKSKASRVFAPRALHHKHLRVLLLQALARPAHHRDIANASAEPLKSLKTMKKVLKDAITIENGSKMGALVVALSLSREVLLGSESPSSRSRRKKCRSRSTPKAEVVPSRMAKRGRWKSSLSRSRKASEP